MHYSQANKMLLTLEIEWLRPDQLNPNFTKVTC